MVQIIRIYHKGKKSSGEIEVCRTTDIEEFRSLVYKGEHSLIFLDRFGVKGKPVLAMSSKPEASSRSGIIQEIAGRIEGLSRSDRIGIFPEMASFRPGAASDKYVYFAMPSNFANQLSKLSNVAEVANVA
ncbi:MAG TPA: hypothetical protein PKA31_02810 [Candidatus Moranbacteria bacterium]|nr:hypothetical protein [Candidatus Moranbacteria bacterium]